MGQKVNPKGLRIGVVKDWESKWYEEKKYSQYLLEDLKIRQFLKERFKRASISKILIERAVNKIWVTVFSARPGIIIGKKGESIEKAKRELEKLINSSNIFLNIKEVSQPELDAQLVAERIASQIEKRVGIKRVMRESASRIMSLGAKGVKIACAGRIGGAEIARKEWIMEGKVPLHTLRADIDYASATAHTLYGCVGVKVWIYKGEVSKLTTEEEKSAITAKKS
ncbi:30S ribosomal protein S3 [Candidatus Aerophobetes bacterium]|nr:30S ribosomal protein S3 [Candidatus Aerophobetes bacterium]